VSSVQGTCKALLARWLRFNFVGVLGIAVQLVTLGLLRTGLHLHYIFATALAVEVAVIHNFIWHERYTWADRQTQAAATRFITFNATTGGFSIVGNLIMMKLLVEGAHVPYLPANIVAIATCSIANFFVSDRLVFRMAKRTSAKQICLRSTAGD
jgi:putative flippase GtrA